MTSPISQVSIWAAMRYKTPQNSSSRTFRNLYRFRGFVVEFRRPVVAYFARPWNSGNEFVLEFVCATNGRDVVPVRWHCNTTSLKTTNQRSFFPPIPPRLGLSTSLSRLNDDFPRTFFPLAMAGGGDDPFPPGPIDPSVGTHGRSSTSIREGFG